MPATQIARHAATTSTRRFNVIRQSKDTALMSPPRDDGLRGGIGGDHALDHDRFVPGRRHEMQLLGRQRLDPFWRLKRLDLETQAAVDVLFGRPLALELLDLVAVPE